MTGFQPLNCVTRHVTGNAYGDFITLGYLPLKRYAVCVGMQEDLEHYVKLFGVLHYCAKPEGKIQKMAEKCYSLLFDEE